MMFGGFSSKFYEKFYVFGGISDIAILNDFWEFDNSLHMWKQIFTENPPSYRYGFGYTSDVDEYGNEIFYIFGGKTLSGIDNQLFM